MATGIPQNDWTDHPTSSLEEFNLGTEIRLEYPGKLREHDILAIDPLDVVRVWPAGKSTQPNRLYFGENLRVLALLLRDSKVAGHVRLIYIDPPYATNSVFQSRSQNNAYADVLIGAQYIEFLRRRLILMRELLAVDGSIYVHVDEKMVAHVKIVMDEVFGNRNFRNWITRKKCNPKNYTRRQYGNVSDFILFYTKSDSYVWNRPLDAWTKERADKEYEYVEEATGRRFKKVPVHAPGIRNGETGKPWRGKNPPPGKHWQFAPSTLDEMDLRGEIYWSTNGNPRRKLYLDSSEGVPVQDVWTEFRDAHNQNIRVTGYPTEKNPDLLRRIVAASSTEGDLVLDAFAGSGTTLESASRLDRRWIGIDNSPEAIRTCLRRMSHGTERMGDFVDKPAVPVASALLFDLSRDDFIPPASSDVHAPITDFELLASRDSSEGLSIVTEWDVRA